MHSEQNPQSPGAAGDQPGQTGQEPQASLGPTEPAPGEPSAAAELAQAEGPPPEAEKDDLPAIQYEIQDAGPLRKKLTITIPRERLDAKRDESISQLLGTVQVPGFRVGRAPRRLIEKRFAPELRQDVRAAMIAAGYRHAIDDSKLKVASEPELTDEQLAAIELPETGPMTFHVEIEVQPEFELPPLKNIPVTRPYLRVTENDVDEAIERLRVNIGRLEVVSEPARPEDVLTADVTFEPEGAEKREHANMQVPLRPRAMEGVPLEDLAEKLTGARAGQTVVLETTVPDGHPDESLRGKKATFTFAVKDVRRLRLPEVDDALAARFGLNTVAELRAWIRGRLEADSVAMQQDLMRRQVYDYLLEHVKLELPTGVLRRMAERTLTRRANELMMRGVPWTSIEQHIDQLSLEAGQEAARELKTFFIMQRVAEELKVQVTQQEVNSLIARMAAMYNRRPDSLRDELQRRGAMPQLVQQAMEIKAVDMVLAEAKIEQAPSPPEEEQPAAEPPPAAPQPAAIAPVGKPAEPAVQAAPAQQAKPRVPGEPVEAAERSADRKKKPAKPEAKPAKPAGESAKGKPKPPKPAKAKPGKPAKAKPARPAKPRGKAKPK